MIISQEQAALAASQLRQRRSAATTTRLHACADVAPSVVSAAVNIAVETPDARPERVALARERLAHEPPDAHDIADKVIARILGDALR